MKKLYIIPQTSTMLILHEVPLAVSGIGSNKGIGYGGVDTDGTLDPSVKGNTLGDSPFDESFFD